MLPSLSPKTPLISENTSPSLEAEKRVKMARSLFLPLLAVTACGGDPFKSGEPDAGGTGGMSGAAGEAGADRGGSGGSTGGTDSIGGTGGSDAGTGGMSGAAGEAGADRGGSGGSTGGTDSIGGTGGSGGINCQLINETKGQVAQVVADSFGMEGEFQPITQGFTSFDDLEPSDAHYEAAEILVALGLVSPGGNFLPNDPTTDCWRDGLNNAANEIPTVFATHQLPLREGEVNRGASSFSHALQVWGATAGSPLTSLTIVNNEDDVPLTVDILCRSTVQGEPVAMSEKTATFSGLTHCSPENGKKAFGMSINFSVDSSATPGDLVQLAVTNVPVPKGQEDNPTFEVTE